MAIRLTLFGESHQPAFAELLTDRDVERFTRLPVPTPPDFPGTWLSGYEAGRRDGTSEAFAIVDEAREFLGVALAFGIEQDAGTGELACIVAPAARSGYVREGVLRSLHVKHDVRQDHEMWSCLPRDQRP